MAALALAVALIAGCSTDGRASGYDLQITSGTAGVPFSKNAVPLSQTMDPKNVDETALLDFFQSPNNPNCSVLPTRRTRACFWRMESDRPSIIDVDAHVFSSKIGFSEVRLQSNFTDFRPTQVNGKPALFFSNKGDSTELVCNIAWGTLTGSVFVTIAAGGSQVPVDLCKATQTWAEMVYPFTTTSPPARPDPKTLATLWKPDALNTPEFLRPNTLSATLGEGPDECTNFTGAIRSCIWELHNKSYRYGTRNLYNVRISSTALPYKEFTERRAKAYPDTNPIQVNGKPAFLYRLFPEVCTIAWPTRSGTAWARITPWGEDDKVDVCAVANRVASTAQPRSQ
ncbi:DUF3558 family protein [Gordonia araii]|uniref:DUF3558 family protein n=1 Tax=Gordonia araii TaxID=263909 RepID=UPI0014781F0A|nr:DUF3558 family protein [Gordonia araii]NNG99050.1 hypothetical protein [Gordonia araii NBRC 100433]